MTITKLIMLVLVTAFGAPLNTQTPQRYVVLEELETPLSQKDNFHAAPDIWLDIAKPIKTFGPVHCEIEYECPITSYELKVVGTTHSRSIPDCCESAPVDEHGWIHGIAPECRLFTSSCSSFFRKCPTDRYSLADHRVICLSQGTC